MISSSGFSLRESTRNGGRVQKSGSRGWRLDIPAGGKGFYRLAQLDDYRELARADFPWSAPIKIKLEARASFRAVPGTWGFGFWNDPFGTLLLQGSRTRFPTLPNSAWFFFASDSNYLSLYDDLPASGQLAATFSSPAKWPIKFLLGLPLISLVFIPPIARWLRSSLRNYVTQDSAVLDLDPVEWHEYEIEWLEEKVIFRVDGLVILKTENSPRSPLGLVIWVDNQFARWLPDGRIGYGTLANPEGAWLQIKSLELTPA